MQEAPSPGQILTGPLFSEPLRVETVQATGVGGWAVGLVGTRSQRFRRATLAHSDLAQLDRVDTAPHQLEAVYDHLLKLARVWFLLADDAGAGKTIMAGLLIRGLELRGLAERILIVCRSNLAFQWQRELKEKFDEKFLVMKGGDIRDQFGVNQ